MHHTFALFDGTWQLQLDLPEAVLVRGSMPPDLDRIFYRFKKRNRSGLNTPPASERALRTRLDSSDDGRRTDAKPVILCSRATR